MMNGGGEALLPGGSGPVARERRFRSRPGRRRGPEHVIIAPAENEQRARDLAGAYRHVLRDLLAADRSRVTFAPGDGGEWLVSVTYSPGPPGG